MRTQVALVVLLAVCATADQHQSRSINEVNDGLDAMEKFVQIFKWKTLENLPVNVVAGYASRSVKFIIAIMNLITGGNSESQTVKLLRQEFAKVNNKLDIISFQLDDVKRLIQWESVRSEYAHYESRIRLASKKFNAYVNAKASEKKIRQKEFIKYFKGKEFSAEKLYQGVMVKDVILSSNLAQGVKSYTKNHRKKVMAFLLAMNRIILRGAQMQIAFAMLTESSATAKVIQKDWERDMKFYAVAMKDIEVSVKKVWRSQMTSDAKEFITKNTQLSSLDFAYALYKFLVDKFEWQYWIVVAYKDVKGEENHMTRNMGGAYFFGLAGRNVVIGRSNPPTSTWSKSKADATLAKVDAKDYYTTNCRYWNDRIHELYPVNGISVTMIMTICYGCKMAVVSLGNRRAYRVLTSKSRKRINAIMFG